MLTAAADALPAIRKSVFLAGYEKFKTEPLRNIKEYDPDWARTLPSEEETRASGIFSKS
jgi:hypothetical protein